MTKYEKFIPARAVLTAALVLLVIAGCGKEKETEWGIYNEPVEAGPLPAAAGADEISIEWQREIGDAGEEGYAILKPAVEDGAVFAANRRGRILRLNGESGQPEWRSAAGSPVFAGVGVGEGLALVALDNGSLLAFDTVTGDKRWDVAINRQLSAVPVAGSGRVVIRTADGLLIGLDAADGSRVWELERRVPGLSLHGDSQPVIDGDAVVTGLASGRIMVNSVVNGREFWEKDISIVRGTNELEQISDVDAPPLLDGNNLYAATYQGDVVSLSLLDSETNWRYKVSSRLPMSIAGRVLYLTDDLGTIVAIDSDTGTVNWQQPGFQGRGISNPIATSGRVFVGDANGNIHLLDAADGTLLQTRRLDRDSIISLRSTENGVLAFSAGGKVAMLRLTVD